VEGRAGKWTFKCLPVIPPHFDLAHRENRIAPQAITRLIKRKDVDALINACDAGREGD